MTNRPGQSKSWLSGLVLLIIMVTFLVIRDQPDGQFHAWILDVGQGDAILIQTPAGDQVLIDGGPGRQILSQISQHMPFWDRKIERVIVSHPHADHLDGLIEFADRYQIDEVWQSGVTFNSPDFERWVADLDINHTPIRLVKGGDVIDFGGLTWEVLFPLEFAPGNELDDQHDATVVIRALIDGHSLLLTGDLDEGHERSLIERWCDTDGCPHLASEVLKVPHHGSRFGSLPDFLTAVSPKVAIISVGKDNSYGHPGQITLDRLTALGAAIFRTDLDGTIEVNLMDTGLVTKSLKP